MKKTLSLICFVTLVALAAGGGFLFMQNRSLAAKNKTLTTDNEKLSQELSTYKTNPEEAAKAEAKRYVEEVGKLYALPQDEEPTAATVKDKEKLKDQPFFAKAENGDVTLIYPNAKLAILYRPSTKQLVNVSSVTIQDQPTATPNPAP